MNKREKIVMALSMGLALAFGVAQGASAMHIMEGYLPLGHCLAWAAICLPFFTWGLIRIQRIVKNHRKTLLLLAMCGAYAFVLSALKIPSVTGSSSHPTGVGLGAILFGPAVMAVLGVIVLLFQALLLAHGGVTTLGANGFSMAVAGPFISFGVYQICKICKIKKPVAVFLAAMLGNLATYCLTSLQLGLAHHGTSTIGQATGEFLGIFALTQIPLAIIEGLVTVVVLMGLESYAKPELRELGYLKREEAMAQ